jgi:hypothetical protein
MFFPLFSDFPHKTENNAERNCKRTGEESGKDGHREDTTH